MRVRTRKKQFWGKGNKGGDVRLEKRTMFLMFLCFVQTTAAKPSKEQKNMTAKLALDKEGANRS